MGKFGGTAKAAMDRIELPTSWSRPVWSGAAARAAAPVAVGVAISARSASSSAWFCSRNSRMCWW